MIVHRRAAGQIKAVDLSLPVAQGRPGGQGHGGQGHGGQGHGGQGHSGQGHGGQGRGDRRGPPSRGSRYEDRGPSRPREFKPKPGPVTPITEEMKKGKAPMRTFGDLMQFFGAKEEKKKPPEKEPKEGGQKPESVAADPPTEAIAAEPTSQANKPEAQVKEVESAVPHTPKAQAGATSQPDASAREASQGEPQTSAEATSGEPPAPTE